MLSSVPLLIMRELISFFKKKLSDEGRYFLPLDVLVLQFIIEKKNMETLGNVPKDALHSMFAMNF